MNSKPLLYFDIVRDVLANFDRKTLCRLQNVNSNFNLIIHKEFDNSPPYLILSELQYYFSSKSIKKEWTMTIKKLFSSLTVPVEFTLLQKIIASKFIRFQFLFVFCDENFHPMQLLDMSHVWQNRRLSVVWLHINNFRPTAEFNRALAKCHSLSVLGQNVVHVINSGRCRRLNIEDYTTNTVRFIGDDPVSNEIPWIKISDFLFRSVGNSRNKRNRRSIHFKTCYTPNREKVIEFIDSVKERFAASNVSLEFSFRLHIWGANSWAALPEFDMQNKQTKQRLQFTSRAWGLHLYT